MIYRYFLLFFLLFSSQFISAQSLFGSIKGVVRDDTEVLPGVTVEISVVGIGTVTSMDGVFFLQKIPSGVHKVVFRYLGSQTIEIEVEVLSGAVIDMGDVKLNISQQELEGIVISGNLEKGSDAKAINMTRSSVSAISVLSANMISKTPDKNAADALKRTVSTNVQTSKGEGNYVSLRGTPNEWTSTLINGSRLPVADEDNTTRAFDYEVLPSDMVEYLIVSRTTTPDMEGDNIGGAINLISKSAADSRILSLNAASGYSMLARKPLFNMDFTYGDRSKNNKFGFIINTSYYGRYYAAHNQKLIYAYNTNQGIKSMHLKNYSGMRNTVGINTGFEYVPNDRVKIEARFLYASMVDDKNQKKLVFNYSEGAGSRVRLQNIHGKLLRKLMGGELSGDFRISNKVKLSASLTSYDSKFKYGNIPFGKNDSRSSSNGYYYAEFISPLLAFTDVDCVDFFGNAIDCDSTDKVITKLIGKDNPYGTGDDPEKLLPQIVYYDFFTGDTVLKAEQFTFNEAFSELNNTREQDPITGSIDLKYDINSKISLKFGLKGKMKNGERNIGQTSWQQDVSGKRPDPYYLTDFQTESFATSAGFLNEFGNPYEPYYFPFLTTAELNNFNNILGDTLKEYKMDKFNNSYLFWVGNSYRYKENVLAGYAMFSARPASKLQMVGGIRLEYTNFEISADTLTDRTESYFDIIGNDTTTRFYNIPETRKATNEYLSVLPSLNAIYSFSSHINLRLAVGRSMYRPNFNQFKPGDFVYKFEEQEITYGNAALKPSYAWNFDLIYEYFWGNKGIASFGVYYKYIKDHIFAFSGSGENALSGIVIKQFDNVDKSYVFGIESLIERKLDMLPGGWGGFGVGLNATYTLSRMQVPGRDKKQSMTEQTPWLVNAKIFYEKYGIDAALAFNYTGSYLHELNLYEVKLQDGTILQQKTNSYDVYHDRTFTLDLQLGYTFKEKFTVYFQANNLLNTPYRMYRGERFRTYSTEYYNAKAQLGFKYNL